VGAIPPVLRDCTFGMSGGGLQAALPSRGTAVVFQSVVMPVRHPGMEYIGNDMNIFRPRHSGRVLPKAGPCALADSENGAQSHLKILVMKGSIEACQRFRRIAVFNLLNSRLPDSFIRRLQEFCTRRVDFI
jgi:hypothetical protein